MYALIISSVVLSVMLVKVCKNNGSRRQQRLPSTQCNFYNPQMGINKGVHISQIRNQIEVHKAEILKLEQLLKQAE
jgi:hypothetical protein